MITNYSNKYFGKDLMEVSFSDIEKFFTEKREESDKIEFKAYSNRTGNENKNIEGVIRAICAFLNSNGGIVIWGAPLEVKRGSKEIYQGELSPVPKLIEKDVLISKISDSITPLPVGVKVGILDGENGFVYVFEIQQSIYRPHQYKNQYFARLDGQTKPAPHYLIEALFKQVSYANIEGYLNFERLVNNDEITVKVILLNTSQNINEQNVIFRIICKEGKFVGHVGSNGSVLITDDKHEYYDKDSIQTIYYGAPVLGTVRIKINMTEIQNKHNNEITFRLVFGGKNSPLKLSKYTLRFETSVYPNNLERHLVLVEENQLLSEINSGFGDSRESFLSKNLKR